MNEINWIELGIKIVLLLVASYLIFYKAFLKYLGKEVAKLSTIEQLTKLEESVKRDFNEKLEDYKIELNEELSLKLEPVKSELAKNNITHQIQFGFLHEERAKVIIELYKKLIELHSAMADWTRQIHPIIDNKEKEEEERTNRANQALFDFKNFYVLNKLFFSDNFCETIDKVFKEYWDKGWDYGYRQQRLLDGQLSKEYQKEYLSDMAKISIEINDKLPDEITKIESLFKEMLKVEEK